MSANIIQSDYTELQQVSRRFTRRAEHIREVHCSITRQARKLSTTWEGHAAHTFEQELYTVLLPALQRLSKSLDQSGVVTGHIAHTLQQAEEAAARLFTGQSGNATLEIPDGIYAFTPDFCASTHVYANRGYGTRIGFRAKKEVDLPGAPPPPSPPASHTPHIRGKSVSCRYQD